MSKVADAFRRSSALIQTPDGNIHDIPDMRGPKTLTMTRKNKKKIKTKNKRKKRKKQEKKQEEGN